LAISKQDADSAAAPSTPAVPIIDVTVIKVGRGAIQPRISAPGSLLARRESHIGAEVRGRIEQVFVHEGDRVAAGDALFQIDPRPFEVALRQARAGLDLARSERMQLEADSERMAALHRKDIVAVDALDRVKTQVAVAKARERQAAEGVAMARHNLDQTRVTAPFAGSIADRLVDEGTTALVQPQTIVVVLQETAQLEARANIPESQVAIVQIGDPVLVHIEGLSAPIETTVTSVSDTIDPSARTYTVEALVPNEDHRLKAGVFARVDVLPRAKREVMLVPRDAVHTEDGRTRVLVVRDGRAVAVPVQIGTVSGDDAEVVGGIEIGSEVISGESAHEIAPGMQVRAVAAEPDPAS
jgi:RND family efflux transporter MFP subunit